MGNKNKESIKAQLFVLMYVLLVLRKGMNPYRL